MKLIFLDVDGVLNCHLKEPQIITPGGPIHQRCLAELNTLTADTGAKIVISSTWRMDEGIEDYLKAAGVTGEIIGKTPIIKDRWALRGNEIHAWIVEHEKLLGKSYQDFHSYIILDDDSDMLYWQRNNFFQTDYFCGLTPNIRYLATKFLNQFD